MDLTEINPAMDRGILTATQAMELLIVGLGAAMGNRTRPVPVDKPRSRASQAQQDLKTDLPAFSQT